MVPSQFFLGKHRKAEKTVLEVNEEVGLLWGQKGQTEVEDIFFLTNLDLQMENNKHPTFLSLDIADRKRLQLGFMWTNLVVSNTSKEILPYFLMIYKLRLPFKWFVG